MPTNPESLADIPFPFSGVDLSTEFEEQNPGTTPIGQNVRAYDPSSLRMRGGARPGLFQYVPAQVNGTAAIQNLDASCVTTDPSGLGGVIDGGSGALIPPTPGSRGDPAAGFGGDGGGGEGGYQPTYNDDRPGGDSVNWKKKKQQKHMRIIYVDGFGDIDAGSQMAFISTLNGIYNVPGRGIKIFIGTAGDPGPNAGYVPGFGDDTDSQLAGYPFPVGTQIFVPSVVQGTPGGMFYPPIRTFLFGTDPNFINANVLVFKAGGIFQGGSGNLYWNQQTTFIPPPVDQFQTTAFLETKSINNTITQTNAFAASVSAFQIVFYYPQRQFNWTQLGWVGTNPDQAEQQVVEQLATCKNGFNGGAKLYDPNTNAVTNGAVLTQDWPSIARTFFGDP